MERPRRRPVRRSGVYDSDGARGCAHVADEDGAVGVRLRGSRARGRHRVGRRLEPGSASQPRGHEGRRPGARVPHWRREGGGGPGRGRARRLHGPQTAGRQARRGGLEAAGAAFPARHAGADESAGRVQGQPARPPGAALGGAADGRPVEGRRVGGEMSERLLVFSTVQAAEDAERIARALVERGLAACVNIVPGLTSVYRWKGEVQAEPERLLLIKTREQRFGERRGALLALDPYELPEIVAVPLEGGHGPYLDWLDAAVQG